MILYNFPRDILTNTNRLFHEIYNATYSYDPMFRLDKIDYIHYISNEMWLVSIYTSPEIYCIPIRLNDPYWIAFKNKQYITVEEDNKLACEIVKYLLWFRDIRQNTLAKEFKITQQAVSKILNNPKHIRRYLDKFSILLNVPIYELYYSRNITDRGVEIKWQDIKMWRHGYLEFE